MENAEWPNFDEREDGPLYPSNRWIMWNGQRVGHALITEEQYSHAIFCIDKYKSLLAALEKYGKHMDYCGGGVRGGNCECGLYAIQTGKEAVYEHPAVCGCCACCDDK